MTYQEIKLISWRVGVAAFEHAVMPESKELAQKAKDWVVVTGTWEPTRRATSAGGFEGENTSLGHGPECELDVCESPLKERSGGGERELFLMGEPLLPAQPLPPRPQAGMCCDCPGRHTDPLRTAGPRGGVGWGEKGSSPLWLSFQKP